MQKLYIIWDRVAEAFIGGIILQRSDAPVVRMFNELLADPQTQLAKHPADYDLRFVGTIDDDGSVIGAGHVVISTGQAWVTSQEPQK